MASCAASARTVASIGGKDAVCLGRLGILLVRGRYWRVQGREEEGLDMVGKEEKRWWRVLMVECQRWHGMAKARHKGSVSSSRECSNDL